MGQSSIRRQRTKAVVLLLAALVSTVPANAWWRWNIDYWTIAQALEQITQLIEEQGGIVKKEQFTELGIDYRRILDFVQSGDLVRIKNGYYTDRIDRFTEEELVARLFGDARLCMESALYAYGYISQKPYGWHLAVDKNTSKSRFKMDYPKIIPYYTEPEALELGFPVTDIQGSYRE